jgi:hypothetical protein
MNNPDWDVIRRMIERFACDGMPQFRLYKNIAPTPSIHPEGTA